MKVMHSYKYKSKKSCCGKKHQKQWFKTVDLIRVFKKLYLLLVKLMREQVSFFREIEMELIKLKHFKKNLRTPSVF
jgi:hypothetical protein